MTDCELAIAMMTEASIEVEATDYGFPIPHYELNGRAFAECGHDNDSSISLSVTTEDSPPVIWFFRKSFTEMAEFLIASYDAAGSPAVSRAVLVAAMRRLDQDYDDTDLKLMTEAFLREIEDED